MKLRYLIYTLLLLLPFVFRDYTPDNELRYISIVDEALENGSVFAFYHHGEAYADKPPLYFWLMMLSRTLFGEHLFWIYGLFCAIPAIGIVVLMNRWIRAEQPYSNVNPAGELLLTTGIFLGATLVMRMDMLMAFFIVLSLYTFYRIYRKKNKPYEKWMLPVSLFLSVFIKGPMGLLIPLVSVLLFITVQKGWKQLPRCFGWKQLVLLLGLCAVWFGGIYIEGGKEYLHNILFRQTVGRGINSFHHQEPFYFYLKTMPYTFAPWTITYLALLWSGFRQNNSVSDMEIYFGSVIVSSLVLLSLISAKLDIYLLPVYPFIVYLSVLQIDKITHWNNWLKGVIILPYIVLALLFPFSWFIFSKLPFPVEASSGIFRMALFVLMLCALLSIYEIYRKAYRKALFCGAIGLLLFLGIGSFGVPPLNPHIGIKEMALASRSLAEENEIERYAYYKFRAGENLHLYLEQTPTRLENIESIDEMAEKTAYLLIVRDRERRRDPNLEQQLSQHLPLGKVSDYEFFMVRKCGESR